MALTPYLFTEELQGTPAIVWERVTREHITSEIRALKLQPELFDLTVDADITTQVVPEEVPKEVPVEGDEGKARFLEEENIKFANNSLIIEFNVAVSFRSISKENDWDELIFSAWNDDTKRESYLNRLKSQSSHYKDVEFVNVEVEGFIPKPTSRPTTFSDPADPPATDDGTNIAIIAGAAGGGGLLLLLCGFFYFRSRNSNDEDVANDQTRATSSTGQKIAA